MWPEYSPPCTSPVPVATPTRTPSSLTHLPGPDHALADGHGAVPPGAPGPLPVSHVILMPTGGCCTLQEDSHMLGRIHKCLGGFTNVWADYEKADFSENNVIMLCSDIK